MQWVDRLNRPSGRFSGWCGWVRYTHHLVLYTVHSNLGVQLAVSFWYATHLCHALCLVYHAFCRCHCCFGDPNHTRQLSITPDRPPGPGSQANLLVPSKCWFPWLSRCSWMLYAPSGMCTLHPNSVSSSWAPLSESWWPICTNCIYWCILLCFTVSMVNSQFWYHC